MFAPVCSRLLWLATVCSMGSLVFLFDVVCFRLCFWQRIGCSISEVTQGEQIVTIRWRIRQFLFLLKRHTVFSLDFASVGSDWLLFAIVCLNLLLFPLCVCVCSRLLVRATVCSIRSRLRTLALIGSLVFPFAGVCFRLLCFGLVPLALVCCRLFRFASEVKL